MFNVGNYDVSTTLELYGDVNLILQKKTFKRYSNKRICRHPYGLPFSSAGVAVL
jgi:hypothetical protein